MGRRVAVVVGTRPEAIKLAPVVRALRRRFGAEAILVSTGQHREMLDQALDAFGLHADVDLGLMRPDQTLHELAARTLVAMRGVLADLRADWTVVQGDTTTAFAAALAAFYAGCPVAHVEAGLRSGRRDLPFPEEANRRLVDQLSDALFAPTERARDALLREGFAPEAIAVTGNTVVDALLWARRTARARGVWPAALPRQAVVGRRVLLVTAHRRESFGAGLEGICRALLAVARAERDVVVLYPVHLNPNVDGPVRRLLGSAPRIVLLPPLGYLELVALLDRADVVLTDSGGIQEEAPTFAKPLLVLRDVTERPEGVEAGVACLVGTDERRIAGEALALLRDPVRYARMASGANPYGDGRAAERIADHLTDAPRALRPAAPEAAGRAASPPPG